MAKYLVSIPFTGYICVEVEADNEKDAITKARKEDLNVSNAEEVYFHDRITEGNVFTGVLNEVEVEQL